MVQDGQPHLNFDVLRYACNFITNVSDALSFSLTCSVLRKVALQRRLWISPVVLSTTLSVHMFHSFILSDPAPRAPYIYGLDLASFYYDVESEDARHRSEAAVRHIVALLELATRLQYLQLQTAAGDQVLTTAAKVTSLRELIVLSGGYGGAMLHRFLSTLSSPLRRLCIEAGGPDECRASFLHAALAHLAPTLEILELEDFPLDLPPSSVATPFTAMRTLKIKTLSFVSRLDVLWRLFPSLETLVVDYMDKRFVGHDFAAARERNRDAQEACTWSCLDHVVCEADIAYIMALECPIRRMDLTVSSAQPLLRLAETLRHTCPRQLRLSLPFNSGLHAMEELFPSEMEANLTHLVIFADIDLQIIDTRPRSDLSWIQFVDGMLGSMNHLRLTHLRIVFHYKTHHISLTPKAISPDESPEISACKTELHLGADRLFDVLPTLQHVFLTHCGRTWVWAGSSTQLRNTWSSSGAWRSAGADDGSGSSYSCVEIGGAEAEAVMDREELQLSQREEDLIRPCNSSMANSPTRGSDHESI